MSDETLQSKEDAAQLQREELRTRRPGEDTCVARLSFSGAGGRVEEMDVPLPEAFYKRWELQERLGAGASGSVYRGLNRSTEELVAIKLLHRIDDAAGLQRFLLEGRIGMEIRHPNVVHVREIGDFDGFPYLVADYVGGGDLKQRIQKLGAMHWKAAVNLVRGILSGLHAIHSRAIVHRDVKPSNILLDTGGRPLISDLGIAKTYASQRHSVNRAPEEPRGTAETPATYDPASAPSLTLPGLIMGTPDYMSPEQIRGEDPAAASDLYAVGAILHELLTGRPPFSASNLPDLLNKQLTAPPPEISGIPEDLARIIRQALSKSISDRPSSAEDFLLRLSRACPTGRVPIPTGKSAVTRTTATAPVLRSAPVEQWWVPRRAPLVCVLALVTAVTVFLEQQSPGWGEGYKISAQVLVPGWIGLMLGGFEVVFALRAGSMERVRHGLAQTGVAICFLLLLVVAGSLADRTYEPPRVKAAAAGVIEALERFRSHQGHYPDELPALVPTELPVLPRRILAGHLKYQHVVSDKGPDSYRLYEVLGSNSRMYYFSGTRRWSGPNAE